MEGCAGRLVFRELDTVRVVGQRKPLTLFEVMLTERDARALGAPRTQAGRFNKYRWTREAFAAGTLAIGANASHTEFLGLDPADGSVYQLATSARAWVLTPESM